MDLLQFYSRWMISQVSSVSFLVYTLLCVEPWNTDSCGVVPKLGEYQGILGVYNITVCNANGNCQKRPNFRIPYFRPSKCRPSSVPPGADAPFPPPLGLVLRGGEKEGKGRRGGVPCTFFLQIYIRPCEVPTFTSRCCSIVCVSLAREWFWA